jgi:3-oxoacyl-ACP reductase-like protein
MATKIIFILIAKTEKKNPSQVELDDTVEKLLDAASILEKEMKLTLGEGEYSHEGTSLMLR